MHEKEPGPTRKPKKLVQENTRTLESGTPARLQRKGVARVDHDSKTKTFPQLTADAQERGILVWRWVPSETRRMQLKHDPAAEVLDRDGDFDHGMEPAENDSCTFPPLPRSVCCDHQCIIASEKQQDPKPSENNAGVSPQSPNLGTISLEDRQGAGADYVALKAMEQSPSQLMLLPADQSRCLLNAVFIRLRSDAISSDGLELRAGLFGSRRMSRRDIMQRTEIVALEWELCLGRVVI
ncbi:hypothetical protein DFH07DRAFT_965759 [Mycena maculata]|uniref:Uncharacterized protein n=1 Tax=Mycena maculata TaxID=230809 RepID=A0AAD7IDK5_9AGAR|nr:hypothetical protein DFH07DRAFT_965759 [Mycena maculata]